MESIMQKQSHTFILGTITLFAIYLYYLSAAPIPPKLTIKDVPKININLEENNTLEYLNTLRVGAGLIPLKRLKWNTQYHLKFSAMIDKNLVKKEWSFSTQTFKMPLHIVKSNNELYSMKKKESHIFYFPPSSKVDLLHDITYPTNIDLAFIDKNTIKLTALSQKKEKQKIVIGKHKIILEIEK